MPMQDITARIRRHLFSGWRYKKRDMVKVIIILIVLSGVFYLLYSNGYMVVSKKRALMFVGSIGGVRNCKATFTSCNGQMMRVVRFKESRLYAFTLHTELTAGEMAVELLDSDKKVIMELNSENQTGSADINCKKRYYLVFRFKATSGSCEFEWE